MSVFYQLEEKILSLSDTKRNDDEFTVHGKTFVKRIDDNTISLFMNEACQKKLEGAISSESRATPDATDPHWVDLVFASDVDLEFIFLYIRYSWKYLQAELT